MIAYKRLLPDGRSPHVRFEWPLPKGDQPGEWLEIDGSPELCRRGFHGYKRRCSVVNDSHLIYEMELDGETVEDSFKIAAARARLLRQIWPPSERDTYIAAKRLIDKPQKWCRGETSNGGRLNAVGALAMAMYGSIPDGVLALDCSKQLAELNDASSHAELMARFDCVIRNETLGQKR